MIRKHAPTAVALTAAALTASAVATGPALAATTTKLTLSVTAEAGHASAVILRCQPAGGGHPSAAKACAALTAAGGKFASLKPTAVMCTLQFAPVTAAATGTWKGKKVTWSRSFGNACELTRATGVVFRF
jgi:hypothetical protein